MSAAQHIPLGRIMPPRRGSVDPAAFPNEEFELYSIPAFDEGVPEILTGSQIGSAKQVVRQGDVLLSRIVPHIRRAWVVGEQNGRRLIASGEWIVFHDDNTDPEYLRHVLVGDRFHAEFMRTVSGVGGSLLRARPANVAKIEIPLPSLPEQRRIAAILDQAEALRAKRRAAIAKLDELTQSIFLDMFGDPTTNPKGWPHIRLRDAYWFQEGPGVRKWQFKSSGIKLLNVGNIEKDGHLNLDKTSRFITEEEAFGKYRHFLIDAGDLVIASSGISFDADGLLRTRGAFVSAEHLPLCMNTSTIRFKAKPSVSDLRFLWVWLAGAEFRSQISKRVTGTAQQNFGPSHLDALSITLPSLDLQQEFARRLDGIEALRVQHLKWTANMGDLFASLQQRAFRGEL